MALWIWGSHGQVHELLGGLHLGSTPGDPLGASVEKLSHCLMFAFPSVCPWDDNAVSMDCCLKYFTWIDLLFSLVNILMEYYAQRNWGPERLLELLSTTVRIPTKSAWRVCYIAWWGLETKPPASWTVILSAQSPRTRLLVSRHTLNEFVLQEWIASHQPFKPCGDTCQPVR